MLRSYWRKSLFKWINLAPRLLSTFIILVFLLATIGMTGFGNLCLMCSFNLPRQLSGSLLKISLSSLSLLSLHKLGLPTVEPAENFSWNQGQPRNVWLCLTHEWSGSSTEFSKFVKNSMKICKIFRKIQKISFASVYDGEFFKDACKTCQENYSFFKSP